MLLIRTINQNYYYFTYSHFVHYNTSPARGDLHIDICHVLSALYWHFLECENGAAAIFTANKFLSEG